MKRKQLFLKKIIEMMKVFIIIRIKLINLRATNQISKIKKILIWIKYKIYKTYYKLIIINKNSQKILINIEINKIYF